MWRLDKPSLQKAKDDLNNIVAHCLAIDNADKIAFENLYDESLLSRLEIIGPEKARI